MSDFASLKGKVALVTGAATGIGRACAKQLCANGAAVLLTDIDREGVEQTTTSLSDQGFRVDSLVQDVTEETHWQEAVDAAVAKLGGLDVLVNNAGIYLGGTLVSNSLEAVQRVHKVNVESIFLGMKYAALAMQPGGAAGNGGSIINLSSVAGLIGVPGHTAYGSSKGAVRLYSKHAAVEFARLGYGIRVNSLHPGVIATAMGDQVFEDFVEVGLAADLDEARVVLDQLTPLARLGTPQDIANMVTFLASDASAFCTGAEFVVDGGLSAT